MGKFGAGDGIRTRDIDLGKVALYQLSYSRSRGTTIMATPERLCQTLCNHIEMKALKSWLKTQPIC
jgi:hypothetical protein